MDNNYNKKTHLITIFSTILSIITASFFLSCNAATSGLTVTLTPYSKKEKEMQFIANHYVGKASYQNIKYVDEKKQTGTCSSYPIYQKLTDYFHYQLHFKKNHLTQYLSYNTWYQKAVFSDIGYKTWNDTSTKLKYWFYTTAMKNKTISANILSVCQIQHPNDEQIFVFSSFLAMYKLVMQSKEKYALLHHSSFQFSQKRLSKR